MSDREQVFWVTANAVGMGAAFLGVLQATMIIEFGFDWDRHWVWDEQPSGGNLMRYLSTLASMLIGGAILGLVQSAALHNKPVRTGRWIVAAAIGFGAFAVAVEWPLAAIGLLGAMSGSVESIIVTVGGGSVAGFCQHLSLHRTGLASGGWLLRWVIGLLAGNVVNTVFLWFVVELLGISLSWPAEIFVSGFLVGGVAAIISGGTLFRLFGGQSRHPSTG